MRLAATLVLSLALSVPLMPLAVPSARAATAATPADVAQQARANWAQTRAALLEAVKPYQAKDAALIGQYTAALDKAGASLENYLALKLASPPTPANKLTPAVDRLIKDLTELRKLRGKAKGSLANVLGDALTKHNEIAQTALKNMR